MNIITELRSLIPLISDFEDEQITPNQNTVIFSVPSKEVFEKQFPDIQNIGTENYDLRYETSWISNNRQFYSYRYQLNSKDSIPLLKYLEKGIRIR